jgi:hypothetical protein
VGDRGGISPPIFQGQGDERVIIEVATSLWRWLQRCDPTLTAGNAYPIPIQPDYRISDLVSGKYFRLAFSVIGRTWCETIWFEEFIRTTDSINCQLVIVDFSPSFRCKPHSQCSSASSSSLSFCSLQSPQPRCPPMSPNAIMIAARYVTPSMALTQTLALARMCY